MFLAIEIKQGQPNLFLMSNIPRKITTIFNYCISSHCRRHVEVKDNAFYGRGSGLILMSDLRCTGNEISIQLCQRIEYPSGCSHSEDVGVSCFNGILICCFLKIICLYFKIHRPSPRKNAKNCIFL